MVVSEEESCQVTQRSGFFEFSEFVVSQVDYFVLVLSGRYQCCAEVLYERDFETAETDLALAERIDVLRRTLDQLDGYPHYRE